MRAAIRAFTFAVVIAATACVTARAEELAPKASDSAEQQTAAPADAEPTSKNSIEQSADTLLKEFVKAFDEATHSLDTANESLIHSGSLKDYDEVLFDVDQLISKINTFADRIRPEGSLFKRIDQTLHEIDSINENVSKDTDLSEEFKEKKISKLSEIKNKIETNRDSLSSARTELLSLAKELKTIRREVAYDVIISEYADAADSLQIASSKVNDAISKLKKYIKQFKEPLTQ